MVHQLIKALKGIAKHLTLNVFVNIHMNVQGNYNDIHDNEKSSYEDHVK